MKCSVIISAIFVLVNGQLGPTPGYQYSSPEKSNISSYAAPLNSVGPLPTIKVRNASESNNSSHKNKISSVQNLNTTNHVDKSVENLMAGKPSNNFTSLNSSDTQAGNITIHKHIYVHLPPSEIKIEHRPKVHVTPPPPQKHYKIIFIKTPTSLAPRIPYIPALRHNEEKTLVYVLVKKPEEQSNIKIPTVALNRPSKPEVYFINYQSREEKSSAKGLDKENEVFAPKSGSSSSYDKNGTSIRRVSSQKESNRAHGPY